MSSKRRYDGEECLFCGAGPLLTWSNHHGGHYDYFCPRCGTFHDEVWDDKAGKYNLVIARQGEFLKGEPWQALQT